jgi:protein phosphatase
MAIADLLTSFTTETGTKPRDDELDLYGVTHPGKVRTENQDHFLVATIHQQIVMHGTSLPDAEHLPLRGQRLGTILMVADGVGGGAAGGEASQLAVSSISSYVTSTMNCFHARGREAEQQFYQALKDAALEAHDTVRAEAASRVPESMSTTLTLALVVWPWYYVLQVGDSRCYTFWDGKLEQITRDQTLAQDLVDKGALPADKAAQSPFSHVLASSIGGREAQPVVRRMDVRPRGRVVLLCSDGLTKHVSDEQIAEQCRTMTSAEQLCRTLLEMALAGGGSDNITVIAGRAKPL